MKALWSFKTLGSTCQTTQHHIWGDSNLQQHCCKNLQSCSVYTSLKFIIIFCAGCLYWYFQIFLLHSIMIYRVLRDSSAWRRVVFSDVVERFYFIEVCTSRPQFVVWIENINTVKPWFYIHAFYLSCDFTHFLFGLGQMPMWTIFPRFYAIFSLSPTITKYQGFTVCLTHLFSCISWEIGCW
jgi:hypothetical protein